MLLPRIGQIAIPARDVERATAFYRDVLGLQFLFSAPPGLSFFDCGGVRLMLAAPEGSGAEASAVAGSVLYFQVQDIGATHGVLAERGVRFVGEPHCIADLGTHELWMAFFHDSEDNLLALMSEVARA